MKELLLNFKNPTIIHHYDTDGISSATILCDFLISNGIEPKLLCMKGLNRFNIDQIKDIDEKILVDLGTHYANVLKDAIIIDHHKPSVNAPNLINAHYLNFDGSVEISSSGLVHFITGNKPEIGLVGAIGDRQWPFIGYNKKLLEKVLLEKKIYSKTDLTLYGKFNRPLFSMLSYFFRDFLLDYRQAIKFLEDLEIKQKDGERWRSYSDLNPEEKEILIKAIIEKAYFMDMDIQDIYNEIYYLNYGGLYNYIDIEELSTIINSVGRQGKSNIGIDILKGNEKALVQGIEISKIQQRKLVNALRYAEENLLEFDKFNVLDGRNVIDSSIIGIVTSMINKSTTIGIAKEENYLKISIRSNTYDVSELIGKIVKEIDAEGGGHTRAGGLVIEEDRLEKFLDIIKKLLEK